MQALLGQPVADMILAEASTRVQTSGVVPGLGVLVVGDDPASHMYVGMKERRAAELGFHFVKKELPPTAEEATVIAALRSLNADPDIHGIIVQLPLPPSLDTDRVLAFLDPNKDADGFHPRTLQRFVRGDTEACPVFPEAMIRLARASHAMAPGKVALGMVRSARFGEVLSEAFAHAGLAGKVYLGHDSPSWRQHLFGADFIFSACGTPGIFSAAEIKDGAVIIDGGIARSGRETRGDFDAREHETKTGYFTPVLGGVGPVTVACLLARVGALALASKARVPAQEIL